MDKGATTPAGIRAHLAADGRLQEEINRALEDFADSLPGSTGLRLVTALAETLDPSWTEHVSFQEHVVFPIVVKRHAGTKDIAAVIDRLQREHAELSERHSEVAERLDDYLNGSSHDAETLGYLLRSAFEFRGRHLESEQRLDGLLPRLFTPSDLALFNDWTASRPRARFPVNLLKLRH